MPRIFVRLLLFFALAYTSACIPIEDTFGPRINNLFVQDRYAVQDTLIATSILTDNFSLEKAYINIVQIAGATASPWQVSDSLDLAGRRFEFEYKTFIPLNAVPGTYEINIEVLDAGGNRTFLRGSFLVTADVRGPVILEDIDLLIEDPAAPYQIIDGRYRLCRQSLILLQGKVTDNVGIRRISAQLGNLPGVTRLIDPPVDTLFVEDAFGNDLRVPATIADGTELDLVVEVTDIEGNTVRDTVLIIVDCDDEIPLISDIAFDPELDSLGNLELIEGESFEVTELFISDNRALETLYIFFNPVGEDLDTVYQVPLNSISEADIAYVQNRLGDRLNFSLPPEAEFGATYQILFLASDTSGNFSEPSTYTINVRNDTPPRITVAEVLINNVLQEADSTQGTAAAPFLIRPRQQVSLLGKITDDREIRRIEVSWGLEGREQNIQTLTSGQLIGTTTFDFDDPRFPAEALIIPENAGDGAIYRLILYAEDDKAASTTRTLYFKVTQ